MEFQHTTYLRILYDSLIKTDCVLCEGGTEFLYIVYKEIRLQRITSLHFTLLHKLTCLKEYNCVIPYNLIIWRFSRKRLAFGMPTKHALSHNTTQAVSLNWKMKWPLACWDCGFESRRGYGCLSLVSVVYCHVEVSAAGWSLVQRGPAECGVFGCNREASIMVH